MDGNSERFFEQLESLENESYFQDLILNISLIHTCQLKEVLGFGPASSMMGYKEAYQDLKSYGLDVSWLPPPKNRLH